jgi:hypothetical protein
MESATAAVSVFAIGKMLTSAQDSGAEFSAQWS